jgi:hypothetical protein
MNLALRISLLAAIFIYSVILVMLLRRKVLTLKYSLLWLFFDLCMIIVVLFPKPFIDSMKWIGIVEPINGLFALSHFLSLLIVMSLTTIVSRISTRNRRIIQELAFLEKRVRDLEKSNPSKKN